MFFELRGGFGRQLDQRLLGCGSRVVDVFAGDLCVDEFHDRAHDHVANAKQHRNVKDRERHYGLDTRDTVEKYREQDGQHADTARRDNYQRHDQGVKNRFLPGFTGSAKLRSAAVAEVQCFVELFAAAFAIHKNLRFIDRADLFLEPIGEVVDHLDMDGLAFESFHGPDDQHDR